MHGWQRWNERPDTLERTQGKGLWASVVAARMVGPEGSVREIQRFCSRQSFIEDSIEGEARVGESIRVRGEGEDNEAPAISHTTYSSARRVIGLFIRKVQTNL